MTIEEQLAVGAAEVIAGADTLLTAFKGTGLQFRHGFNYRFNDENYEYHLHFEPNLNDSGGLTIGLRREDNP